MSKEKYREIAFPCERDSLGEAIQMFYGFGAKPIPLAYGGYDRLDNNILDLTKEVPGDIIRMIGDRKSNIGIELGRNSRNLFVVTIPSEYFEEMPPALRDLAKWISTVGSIYHLWFFLKGGLAANYQTEKYNIQAEGIILAPPSVDHNGEFCSWIKREDIFPPSIDKNTAAMIFPHFNIKPLNPLQLNDLQLNIRKEEIKQAIAFAVTRRWDGRATSSTFKLYVACCLRADLEDLDCFRASDRELSEIANLSEKTVRAHKIILTEMGAIYSARLINQTSHYGLNQDFFKHSEIPDHNAGFILPILNNDAFSRQGLNPSGAHIYSMLMIAPQASYKDISRTTGISYSTVKKTMELLIAKGLVIFKNGHWHAVPSSKILLEKIAKNYGVHGRAKRRKLLHKHERNKFISSSFWRFLKAS